MVGSPLAGSRRSLARPGLKPGMEVVDLCCGDGWFTLPLASVAHTVVAIDIDDRPLKAASIRFAERGGGLNVTLIEAELIFWS